ncbi:peptidoglycan D,D-transpeptidase FtsI family protein [Eggerthella sinensis]|uniref:peptidoglycan D,D-transpeptidase FtsI family protein n=1 Tax=Eggerthella sinensis TaxID=242230 RepID=UPI001D082D73|nr:penicillin-binding protein 2 [Eggerthella sinensis]MCB7037340.1 penicillin-binding protein 2 [Eggerthella sinensis]
MPVNPNSNRVFLPILVFAALAALFVLRLAFLQVIAAPQNAAEGENARMKYTWIEPRRGTIYDRNGVVLATSVETTTIYIDPTEVDDADATAQVLVDVLGGQKSDYLEAITAANTRYAVVKEKADVEVGESVKARVSELTAVGAPYEDKDFGIRYKTLWKREYPNGQVGGQVVGACKLDTEVENNREYYTGISGLELYYDDILSGEAGYTREETSPDGTPIPGGEHDSKEAVNGQDIIISIDIELQQYVEDRLTADKEGITSNGGSAVVMDGGTGEIYAAASLPLFNPADRTDMEDDAPKLKCVTDLFEPGSIFKSVSAMAILEAGTMTPDTELFCPSTIEADGYIISDAHDRGDATFTLQQIMDQSSNIGISLATENATVGDVSGFENLYNKINAYNLHTKTGVDFPGEGELGTDILGNLPSFDKWGKVVGYNISFGQGLSLTPLQITRFYSALVNDGVECTPHFLLSKPQSGEVMEYESEKVIDNSAAIDDLTSMLKTVVTEGTGKAAAIEGYNVAGKTSTAEIYDEENGGYRKGVYNLAFTGFLADSSSQLVCFVGANEVPTDGVVTPIFKDIMSTAIDRFNIYPE